MKKLLPILSLLALCSCSFLDVDPEMGLTEEDVFSYYANIEAYFNQVYNAPAASSFPSTKKDYQECFAMMFDRNTYRSSLYVATPAADNGRRGGTMQSLKRGIITENTMSYFCLDNNGNRSPVSGAMFKIIRVSNQILENIDRVTDGKQQDLDDLVAQAYFFRGYAHFCLARWNGGMPYIDHALQADDDWDLERLPLYDTYALAAQDLQTAYEYFVKAGKVRRDTPETLGTATDFHKPNGTAALALKARALLYAASPLANPEGDAEKWKAAAEACAEALKVAEQQGYALQKLSTWKENFIEVAATNENIWAYALKANDLDATWNIYVYGQNVTTSSSGICPTQNYVDKFETKWGDPLNTEADRSAAIKLGHYKDQDPYANRDPRFDLTILCDGDTTKYDVVVNLYKDKSGSWPATKLNSSTSEKFAIEWGSADNQSNGYCQTGYCAEKYWRGSILSDTYYHLDPAIRLAEMYLNYAEAVNEAYGPSGTAGGYSMTALQALNKVRARAEMPDLAAKYSSGKDAFRTRLQNERNVELAFEGHHYYYDIRRWKTAPDEYSQRLYGMYITECDVTAEHPRGRIYERRELDEIKQTTGWKDYMYFIPFPNNEIIKMTNFKNNDPWQ